MSIPVRLLTAGEFFVWPDEPGFRQELIRGKVVMSPLAGGHHGRVASEISRLVANHVCALGLGNTYAAGTGFIVERDPDSVRAADVSFVARQRLLLITNPEEYVPFAPDLAVEVLAPDDRHQEIQDKVQVWLAAGTQIVWTVDPESRTVVVHRRGAKPVTLREEDEIDAGDVIPGFRCRVAEFFA
jgi:Uma2 family endonuclease